MAVRIVFHGFKVRAVIHDAERDYTDLQSKLDVFTEITGHQLFYQVEINPEGGEMITYYVNLKDDESAVEFKLRWL